MVIKATENGWRGDIQPGGRGSKRYRKTFKTKAEAIAWDRHMQAKTQENPEWMPDKKDARSLSDLVELWFKFHGSGLLSGAGTRRRLLAMSAAMLNPRADKFTAEMFADYRHRRVEGGISQNNMNREHSYLRAMFNELVRLGYWKKTNPLEHLRAFKIQESELSYLTKAQIYLLLNELNTSRNRHVTLISKICLQTGARWGEAEGLRASQIKNRQIQFARTKSGKVRSVPISNELQEEIFTHIAEGEKTAQIFSSALSAFREGIERAKIDLPDGQMSHVLRHSFASHFMMNGGNILVLQRVLGHSDLRMTMRYAHLAPEHLEDVVKLNPLSTSRILKL
jgi:integrase